MSEDLGTGARRILSASSRRGFLIGAAASLLAAPAIVRAASLMPVKAPRLRQPVWMGVDFGSEEPTTIFATYDLRTRQWTVNQIDTASADIFAAATVSA